MGISVKLEMFEGPLDLLLHLIDKNKIDIYDIPIVEITAQYMEYVNAMDHQDLDVISEFLVMAATLLDIKSRMLLPPDEDEEGEEIDPRGELVERLLEYKMYKAMAQELKDRLTDAGQHLYKPPTVPPEVAKYEEPVDLNRLLDGLTLRKLEDIFRQVMQRREDKIDPIRSSFGNIRKDPVRLSDKLLHVIDYAQKSPRFSFRSLLEQSREKPEVVVTFLAVLELIKIGKLSVAQEKIFADILLEWNPDNTIELRKEDLEQYD